MRLNAGVHGLSMSDYARRTCLGIRLRRTPEEKRRLRELARIGVNINQPVKWVSTCKWVTNTTVAALRRQHPDMKTS